MGKKLQFKELQLSDVFREHLDGLLLGDGYLTNQNKSPKSASFEVKNGSMSYLEWLGDLFSMEDVDFKIQEVYKGSFEGSKTSYSLETKFYVTFKEIRERWYSYETGVRKKIIPSDLKITKNMMLQWLIGDGYVVNSKGVPVRVMFCTDCFTVDEVLFLKSLLESEIHGIEVQVADRNRLRIPKRHLKLLYEYLPDCPVIDLEYKWKPVM